MFVRTILAATISSSALVAGVAGCNMNDRGSDMSSMSKDDMMKKGDKMIMDGQMM